MINGLGLINPPEMSGKKELKMLFWFQSEIMPIKTRTNVPKTLQIDKRT